jgi:hypothetical protein
MQTLSIATPRTIIPANDVDAEVTAAELGWLEQYLLEVRSFTDLSDITVAQNFEAAQLRLERLALALGMPENYEMDADNWAEDYLQRASANGWRGSVRAYMAPAAEFTVGTPEYRAQHIAMLWTHALWHEAVMVGFGFGSILFLFYAIVSGMQ